MTRNRLAHEHGFTLVELLVVILIIGVLAGAALTTFVGQRPKAQDTSAKSNARNMMTEVESCFAQAQDYGDCTTAGATELKHDIPDTTVSSTSKGHFLITATSRSSNTFLIERNGATTDRTCTAAGSTSGGCPAALTW